MDGIEVIPEDQVEILTDIPENEINKENENYVKSNFLISSKYKSTLLENKLMVLSIDAKKDGELYAKLSSPYDLQFPAQRAIIIKIILRKKTPRMEYPRSLFA